MKRANMYLPMAALILAALAVPAAAQQQVPFKGTFQGNDNVTPPTTIATTGKGMGTHLGQFSFTQEVTVNVANFTDTGSAHWIAANGDSIYTTVVGSAVPGPVVFKITEIHTITGGTGRFTGAQGSFTVDRTHTVEPSAPTERTSPPARSTGPLLPRAQLTEDGQYSHRRRAPRCSTA
jgi:hypothetical protein